MTNGLDTDFLVACEIVDHPFHQSADTLLQKLLADEHNFALAPQTLAEFMEARGRLAGFVILVIAARSGYEGGILESPFSDSLISLDRNGKN